MKNKKHLRPNTSQFYVLQTNMLSWLVSSSFLFLNLAASILSWVLANTDMCHSAQQGYVYHDSFCPKISCLAFGEGSYYFHKMWTKAQPPTFFKKNLENLFCHLDSSKLWYLCYNSDQVWIIPSNFELRTVWAVRGQSECHVDHTSHVSHRCAYRSKNTALLRKATPSSVPSVKQRIEEHNPCEDVMGTALTIAFAHFPLLWENLPNDRWLINGKSPTFPDSEDHVH